MKIAGRTLLLSALLASPLFADVPVYTDGELSLGNAAIISPARIRYYTNVVLALNPDGTLTIVNADVRDLADVEEVEVVLLGTSPVQASVAVSGNLPTPCNALEEPAISLSGNTFTVVLAVSEQADGEVCAQVIEPFEEIIPLPVEGLDAGTYTVIVNGKQDTFTLDEDNI